MKFGYILPNYGDKIKPKELLEISAVCEEVGFDSVWATDHVIMPTALREPYGQVLEPLTTLALIASRTDKIKVGTSCIVLPQRNPILLAKQASTLDVFSNGRLILGLGAGWAEEEFASMNADFQRRGRIMNESIKLMKILWREDTINFQGEFFRVKESLFLPKPVKKDIPVWIGGNGRSSIRRVVTLGDGWHPVGIDVEDFKEGARMVREGKGNATLSVRMTTDVRKRRENYVGAGGGKRVAVSGSSTEIRKQIDAYAEVGLEYYCASINHPAASEISVDLRKFSSEIIRSYG